MNPYIDRYNIKITHSKEEVFFPFVSLTRQGIKKCFESTV